MINFQTLSLDQVKPGDQVTLLSLNAGKSLVNRFNALGLTPGAAIQVVQNIGRGPLIVSVRGARIALGRGEAESLMVERHQP